MNRRHALAISLLLGLAIVAGAFAATRGGQHPGAQTTVTSISGNALAAAKARLDRDEATLDKLIAHGRAGRNADSGAAAVPVTTTVPAEAQQWEVDDHGEDQHGENDSSGRVPDDDGSHEDDD